MRNRLTDHTLATARVSAYPTLSSNFNPKSFVASHPQRIKNPVAMAPGSDLPNATLKLQPQQLRRLDRIFHRQLTKYLFTKTVDDQRDGVFLRDAALL